MPTKPKFSLYYLLALTPLALAAIAWPMINPPFESSDLGLFVLSALVVAAAAQLRIQLPKTESTLAFSDMVVMFSLLYFGGEYAVAMAVVAAVSFGFRRLWSGSFISLLTNVSVSLITVFVTAITVLVLFGDPDTLVLRLESWDFVLIIAVMSGVPFLTNTLLRSAVYAIERESSYWQEIMDRLADTAVVSVAPAFMAGLSIVALHDANVFLFFAVAGFFGMLQIVFRRCRIDFDKSERAAARSHQEKSKLSEKHVFELKHYINELERSSQALRESHEKYRHAAYHDSLTHLPNRNRFMQEIDRLLQRCQHVPSHRFALLYLDLHRFKTVNDSLGHAIGDQLINQVAGRLTALLSNGQIVGRFSGDEFAVLMPEINEPADAEELARQIVDTLSQPFELQRRQIFTGVSIGVTIGSSKYLQAGDVLRDADIAMYRSKERKRSVVTFEESMHVQAMSLLQLETDLRIAVEREEFELFYQPIVDLNTMSFAGVEALVRWSHPEFGHISPDKFIELAEATGLVIPMTKQIMVSAFDRLKGWNSTMSAQRPLFVSINLSGKHFNHPDVVEDIQTALTATGVDPHFVKLEITETAVMDNAERAAAVLKQIKALGVQLSIDDFGTGYSSLSYLQRFPIDTLKIDRSFVRSMEDGRQNGEIVRMILALADAMKLSVVAEGIESVHQLHQLRILNCSYGQGYLFSHPLPVNEIEALLLAPNRWENLVSGSNFAIMPPKGETIEERVH